MNDPQTQMRGALSRVRDKVGEYWVPNAPFQMPGLDIAAKARVPELGEDTHAVLGGLLGYSPAQSAACAHKRGATH
jgi:crotonobetainyl-CoA:carnitine CoA-transferase CaiB-like acyl-CoA transferase